MAINTSIEAARDDEGTQGLAAIASPRITGKAIATSN